MTDTEIIIAVAKLDGFNSVKIKMDGKKPFVSGERADWFGCRVPDYLISRDAIIPVIEKQPQVIQYRTNTEFQDLDVELKFLATPKQLCIALLKATGGFEP